MNVTPRPGIPPLAGLATYEEAACPGFSVEENVELLRRYNYVETRLFEISNAFMNPTPEWEVKQALSLHLYLDAEHSQALRQRVGELRRPPLFLDRSPDPPLESCLDEALRARNTVELLTGLFRVLRPALRDAYRQHVARTNPVFDFPTVRLLRVAISEEEQMIAWGRQALEALTSDPDSRQSAEEWEHHLRAYLQAAGGITGRDAIPEGLEPPAPRAVDVFVPDVDPRRDGRSGAIYNFYYRAGDVYRDETADPAERVLALMFKRLHEMDVPEMMASILLETKDKPWEYYRDMARQLWDEARHAMMGEVWFARHGVDWSRYPNHVGWSLRLNREFTPLERHIVLYGIEQNLMDGETGKRFEWRIAQQADDPLATYLQDYDWADEVLHAQIGRRWLKPDTGDVKAILERYREIAGRPSPLLKARAQNTPQEDWWPRYVQDVLGRDTTSCAGLQSPKSPTFQASSSG
jgi:hypothetical protein